MLSYDFLTNYLWLSSVIINHFAFLKVNLPDQGLHNRVNYLDKKKVTNEVENQEKGEEKEEEDEGEEEEEGRRRK